MFMLIITFFIIAIGEFLPLLIAFLYSLGVPPFLLPLILPSATALLFIMPAGEVLSTATFVALTFFSLTGLAVILFLLDDVLC